MPLCLTFGNQLFIIFHIQVRCQLHRLQVRDLVAFSKLLGSKANKSDHGDPKTFETQRQTHQLSYLSFFENARGPLAAMSAFGRPVFEAEGRFVV